NSRFCIYRRKPLTDEDIQALIFDCPSGSEDENLESSDSGDEYTRLPQASSGDSEGDSSEDSDVEVTSTTKNKKRRIWHWVKKDIPINRGQEVRVLRPRPGLECAKSPLGMFLKFVDYDLLEYLTFETNRYRVQQNRTRVLPVSLLDMRKFLGIVLYMSVVHLPSRRMYWSANTRIEDVARCMSRNRFEEILSLFHASDNDKEVPRGSDGYDRLYKVRHMITALNTNFWQASEIESCVSVDEMMIPFKGRHSLKVYMRNKPSKWGYKAWTLPGRSGYVYKLYLFGDNLVMDAPDSPEGVGESGKIVLRLRTVRQGLRSSLTTFLLQWNSSKK
ncbi:piggyBac transposable element-derived protein 2-like, partial [Ornithodoros turicata]|uniref:piggyBac transposable element-derived protein 2-like n=1 Tax=Ornithodoros turicata TaxID=34597 RepID=UPI00313A0695